MLEPTRPSSSSSFQHWRQFCAATTADAASADTLLSHAAALIMQIWPAVACAIRYQPPHGPALEVAEGRLRAELRRELSTAEQALDAAPTGSLRQELARGWLISQPLTVADERRGAIHLVLAHEPEALDELELIAEMLANALTRQAAKTADARHARYTAALEQIADGVLLIDAGSGRLLEANRALHELLGYSATELATLRLHELLVDDRASVEQLIAEARSRRHLSIVAQRCQHKAGGQLIVTATIDLIELDGRALLCIIMRDATEHQRIARELRQHEDTGQQIVSTMGQGLTLTDAAGTFEFVNPAYAAMLGYTPDQLIGRSLAEFTVAAPDAARPGSASAFETRLQRADGSLVDVLVTTAPRIIDGEPTGAIAVLTDLTERKRAEAETARLAQALRIERDRLLRREVEVRTQIGRDLHDGPVQQVAVAILGTQYVRKVAQHEPERLAEALDELEQQLQQAIQDLRTVLYELRPLGITEEGLLAVLRQYVKRVRTVRGLRIHLDAPKELRRLAPDHEAAVFIIMQEALNNVRKHAAARDVWLTLRDQGSALFAEVRDNGRGFDLEQAQASYIQRGSFGLLNMHERAQLIGGTCAVSSQPGQGTTVRISIPFEQPAAVNPEHEL